LVAVLLAGCSSRQDYEAATAACGVFHQQVDTGQYGSVYDRAIPAFRTSLSRERLVGFLSRIARKMGKCDGATVTSSGSRSTLSGTFVTITATRMCANGTLGEQFIWEMADGKAKLLR
jgi:hypothetical protein